MAQGAALHRPKHGSGLFPRCGFPSRLRPVTIGSGLSHIHQRNGHEALFFKEPTPAFLGPFCRDDIGSPGALQRAILRCAPFSLFGKAISAPRAACLDWRGTGDDLGPSFRPCPGVNCGACHAVGTTGAHRRTRRSVQQPGDRPWRSPQPGQRPTASACAGAD